MSNTYTASRPLAFRLPWLLASVSILALFATVFWANQRTPALDPRLQELMARVQQLEDIDHRLQTVSGTATQNGAIATMRTRAAKGMAPIEEEMLRRRAQSPEQQEAERLRELRQFESAFQQDAADPVGAAQVETSLEKAVTSPVLAGLQPPPDDVRVDCRAHSCRIAATFKNSADADGWAAYYLVAAGPGAILRSNSLLLSRSDGSAEVRIFAVRAGS